MSRSIKIAIAQLNFHVGNLPYNFKKISDSIAEAKLRGADLVVFPELSVCGYPPKDLLLLDGFVEDCLKVVESLAVQCKGISAIVGSPSFNPAPNGKSLLNSAFLLADGKVRDVYHKGLMPTYDVFNEYRYFEPATHFEPFHLRDVRLALTICEDIWNVSSRPMYSCTPPDLLAEHNPHVLINISACPTSRGHLTRRRQVLAHNARKYQLPVFSVNPVGGQTDLLFDGGSAVINARGEVVDSLPLFEEGLVVYDLDKVEQSTGVSPDLSLAPDNELPYLMDALVMGVADYFSKTGHSKAILGLSGGIDSAVTLAVAVQALGAKNVWAVLLPGPFSSNHSVEDALMLARKLGVRNSTISINDAVLSLESAMSSHFEGTERGVAEENIQARARGIILMGLANKFGHLLLNTSNKSEAAVGYGTLYGDMCGGLSVLGDVYKTRVFDLARWINRNDEIIPWNTINKPPSAELRPDQKDSDSLPPYDILDKVLFGYLEGAKGVQGLMAEGYPRELVEKVVRLVDLNEHKRYQSPPVLRVSSKSLGVGREMPLEGFYRPFSNT